MGHEAPKSVFSVIVTLQRRIRGTSEHQFSLLRLPGVGVAATPSPPVDAVEGNANGHGQAHRPGEVSKQYHVCTGLRFTANDYNTPKQDGVHDELERIFVLSPMNEGRYTAAEHQAGKEH